MMPTSFKSVKFFHTRVYMYTERV